MNPLADQHLYLADQSEDQRASDYPYAAPECAYVLDHGLEHYPDSPLFLAKKGLFIAGVLPNQFEQAKKLFNQAINELPNYQPIKDDFDVIKR